MNQILTVNEVKQKIDIKFWFLHEWFDPRLVWNPVMYEGIVCDQIYQKVTNLRIDQRQNHQLKSLIHP